MVAVVRERDAGRCGSAPTRQRKFEILNLANPKFTSRRVVQAARGPVANPSDPVRAQRTRARVACGAARYRDPVTRPSPGGRARVHRVPRGGAGGLSGPLNSVTLAVSADGPVARARVARAGPASESPEARSRACCKPGKVTESLEYL